MRVLLTGASGLIGSAIARALRLDGHEVTGIARDPGAAQLADPDVAWLCADLRELTAPEAWWPLLAGIDAVVNAAGALQTGLRDDVRAVQRDAVIALGQAAAAVGVSRFVQISAAGADGQPGSDFMATKAEADAALSAIGERSGMACLVLRPGLVIGRNCFGGTELLRAAAGMPGMAPEFPGTAPIQCVALSDVVEAVRRALTLPEAPSGAFDLVEEEARSLGEIVALHRQWLGLGPARVRLAVPGWLLVPLTLAADGLGWLGWRSPLRGNAVRALARGVSGQARDGVAVLGRPALSLPETLAAIGMAGKADRWHARIALLHPLALAVLVALWLGSGMLGLARHDMAVGLLASAGVGRPVASACVVAGSLADLAIGLGIVFRPTLPLALKCGLAVASAYVAGSLVLLPHLWLDPMAPMLKVLPILALMAISLAMAEER